MKTEIVKVTPEISRRGFLQGIGIFAGIITLASLPMPVKALLPADTQEPLEPLESVKPRAVRSVILPDGTECIISDWGDYPLWSRADLDPDDFIDQPVPKRHEGKIRRRGKKLIYL
jgi:hypothetical protein